MTAATRLAHDQNDLTLGCHESLQSRGPPIAGFTAASLVLFGRSPQMVCVTGSKSHE
jgi:hypothetical protein